MSTTGVMRETILGMKDPVAQRYTFCRYVLHEPKMDAAILAGRFQSLGPMNEAEYDTVSAGWFVAEATK